MRVQDGKMSILPKVFIIVDAVLLQEVVLLHGEDLTVGRVEHRLQLVRAKAGQRHLVPQNNINYSSCLQLHLKLKKSFKIEKPFTATSNKSCTPQS